MGVKSMGVRMNKLEKEICQALERIARDDRKKEIRRRAWTKRVKQELFDLGRKHDFGLYANIRGAEWMQWMFDLAWAKGRDRGETTFTGLALVMESEWNWDWDSLEIDFSKLVVARADRRLFIFEQRNAEKVDEIIGRCQRVVRHFKGTMSGDRYLFAGYALKEERFTYRLWAV
jgi:hypothetical protein